MVCDSTLNSLTIEPTSLSAGEKILEDEESSTVFTETGDDGVDTTMGETC